MKIDAYSSTWFLLNSVCEISSSSASKFWNMEWYVTKIDDCDVERNAKICRKEETLIYRESLSSSVWKGVKTNDLLVSRCATLSKRRYVIKLDYTSLINLDWDLMLLDVGQYSNDGCVSFNNINGYMTKSHQYL